MPAYCAPRTVVNLAGEIETATERENTTATNPEIGSSDSISSCVCSALGIVRPHPRGQSSLFYGSESSSALQKYTQSSLCALKHTVYRCLLLLLLWEHCRARMSSDLERDERSVIKDEYRGSFLFSSCSLFFFFFLYRDTLSTQGSSFLFFLLALPSIPFTPSTTWMSLLFALEAHRRTHNPPRSSFFPFLAYRLVPDSPLFRWDIHKGPFASSW